MIENKILEIIAEAEHNDTNLLSFYTKVIDKNDDVSNKLLKTFAFFESEIDEKKHKKKIDLEDINFEFSTNHDVQKELDSIEFKVDLKKFNTGKTHWGYFFPLSEKRIEKHKEAITQALSYQNPKYNPKHFNETGFKLYKYLVENYAKDKGHNIDYAHIWRFMNKKHKNENGKVIFRFTQKEYLNFVGLDKLKFQIEGFTYKDKVQPALQDLMSKFFESLK